MFPMYRIRSRTSWLPLATVLSLGCGVVAWAGGSAPEFEQAWGPRYRARVQTRAALHAAPDPRLRRFSAVRYWNQVAIDATGLDHAPVAAGEQRVFGEQLGPGRSSRAIAIVHVAIFEAVNAIKGGYQSYAGMAHTGSSANMQAAVAQAAHDALVAVFPSQAESFHAHLADSLAEIRGGIAKQRGLAVGRAAAAAVLAMRAQDGSLHDEPRLDTDFFTLNDAGKWRQDPISAVPIAMGARWGEVSPFVLQSARQFRTPPPPAMESAEYAAAYDEVKRLGGDGVITPTERTPEQTFVGIFWAYDGTPSLCAPPRLYNQIALQVATQMRTNDVDLARLLALLNVSMADAGIASWESKFFWQCWRPVTGIREADPGTGPTGAGDGNPATICDPTFTPLGAPASNLTGPNFTPPFPAYPSGHATFGGAIFETLRNFYGKDRLPFTFVSDEFNGVTRDNSGAVRPYIPRRFASFSQAEEENGQSRIYLGIHWSFDKTEGIAQGRKIADYVFANAFRPVRGGKKR